jgi:hypothetical protein
MFASSSLVEHLARGVVGICALSYAISISAQHSVYSLALAGVSLLAFRGCPICWTIGFVETSYRAVRDWLIKRSMPENSARTRRRREDSSDASLIG